MRTKLFVSYSHGDAHWRERFRRHLITMIRNKDLWIDRQTIGDGENWESQIRAGITESRCALILLTPGYLACDSYASEFELPMLLEEQKNGLRLLPVLVENVSFRARSELRPLQLVHWGNDVMMTDEDPPKEVPRPLVDAGIERVHNAEERDSVIDFAVMKVCERVRGELGTVGSVTKDQLTELPDQTEAAVRAAVEAPEKLEFGLAGHPGEHTIVYHSKFAGQEVAIKALPTATWRNRVDQALADAMGVAEKLGGGYFIRVKKKFSEADVHGVVMEYIDWPTLDAKLAEYPGRHLPPNLVAKVLAPIAEAQCVAHRAGVQLGALSTGSIYVDADWAVRLSPFRIEALLARGLDMSVGQLVNWDDIAMLTPEVYDGCAAAAADPDAHDQYYLGLLGLELLLGRRPVEVTCFRDLGEKSKFFADPRGYFDAGPDVERRWTDDEPALAFLLAKMLARLPDGRLSRGTAHDELRRIAEGGLPRALRRQLEADLPAVRSAEFATRFYTRLFAARPQLEKMFGDIDQQSAMLAHGVRDLVEYHRGEGADRFLDYAAKHKEMQITHEDATAFRTAFVDEVLATCGRGPSGSVSARTRGDAWQAALKQGLAAMLADR